LKNDLNIECFLSYPHYLPSTCHSTVSQSIVCSWQIAKWIKESFQRSQLT